ncbi:uncharacterized protein LOC132203836 isoform X2 [Neocloeon triangulifer]|nr:uncharacterized protein LOC132203836 isoform X2 [Neocloeon triangulifer]XP_059487945.1 uncharacterized protein LOC132203836 isoform X2 [Neocloeon triangulifer]XP_059487947.1 uncharacterized protein LOC132203836 isoform X2 [Neocloeon triangulifer]XP_059487948.1 uncharacterized protein LOC132203836 isoform X2 [Neocloeon triangulifer]
MIFVHSPSSAMHGAIKSGNWSLIRDLRDDGQVFCTGVGLNCFILASLQVHLPSDGCCKLVAKMLQVEPGGVQARAEDGSTILMKFLTNKEMIEFLVAKGCDIDACDNSGNSVLMQCFLSPSQSPEAFTCLLELGAEPTLSKEEAGPVKFLNLLLKQHHSYPKCALKDTSGQMIVSVLTSQPPGFFSQAEVKTKHPWEIFLAHTDDLQSCSFQSLFLALAETFRPTRNYQPFLSMSNIPSKAEQLHHGVQQLWDQKLQMLKTNWPLHLEPMGLFLYSLRFKDMQAEDFAVALNLLRVLYDNGYNHPYSKFVIHPLSALIMNTLFARFQRISSNLGENSSSKSFQFLHQCIILFKDSQIPWDSLKKRELVVALLQICPPASKDLVKESIFELMKLNPSHPVLQMMSMLSPNPQHPHLTLKETEKTFLVQCAKDCFAKQGLARMGGLLDPSHLQVEFLEAGDVCLKYMVNLCKARTKFICSLKDLSRWALREAIHSKMTNKNFPLPAYIKRLAESNLIPTTLQPYLLLD